MDDYQRKIRQRLKDDFVHYASKCLKLRVKSGNIIAFEINKAQRYLHEKIEQQRSATGKVRVIVLKGRQQGVSTYIEGRFYWLVTHRFGYRAFILTHDNEATNNLFDMAKRYHDHCPPIVRVAIEASNAKELIFSGLDSGYKLGTAGNKAVGRSSTIQLLHGSECGFWPNAAEHSKGIMQAVPNEIGTEIYLESTANGIGNYFHEQWQLAEVGESPFMAVFLPWYWQNEYAEPVSEDFELYEDDVEIQRLYGLSNEQLQWRRSKIKELSVSGSDGNKAFKQEYPLNAVEAFQATGKDSFIASHVVMAARKSSVNKNGRLIIGVDPAWDGDDRTSIIRRMGRVAYNLQSYSKLDPMQVVGKVHRIIVDEKPDKVCVDIGGLGAGIYDRLRELGHDDVVVGVNSARTAINEDRYANKRAEMWGEMLEWLIDQPASIPDLDSLHADLCGPINIGDSKDRIRLEKKEDMKKRGIRSPDEADALALTFALPNLPRRETKKKEYAQIAKGFGDHFNQIDRIKKKAYK